MSRAPTVAAAPSFVNGGSHTLIVIAVDAAADDGQS
jgi:hypothetical protein